MQKLLVDQGLHILRETLFLDPGKFKKVLPIHIFGLDLPSCAYLHLPVLCLLHSTLQFVKVQAIILKRSNMNCINIYIYIWIVKQFAKKNFKMEEGVRTHTHTHKINTSAPPHR